MHQPGDEMTFDDVRYGSHLTMHVKLTAAPGEANAAVASTDNDGNSSDMPEGAVVSSRSV